jgi:hypothetical protein
VQEHKASLFELVGTGADRGRVGDLELDRRLRDGMIVGPGRLAEAGLSGFCEWPDTEVLGAGDMLARPVVAPLARREREPQGVDVELARPARRRGK